jgi:hypothetical protein
MLLFSKDGCTSCDYIKKNFDLPRLGVEVKMLGNDAAEALAELAWYGLVEEAEKGLPILVCDDDRPLTGSEAVRDYLIQRSYSLVAT